MLIFISTDNFKSFFRKETFTFSFLAICFALILTGCATTVANVSVPYQNDTKMETMIVDVSNQQDIIDDAQLLHGFISGELSFREDRYFEAQESFEELKVRMGSAPPIISEKLGFLYLKQGKVASSIKEILAALDKEPENIELRSILGQLYELDLKDDLALAEYRLILQKDPQRADAAIYLGALLARQSRFDESIAVLQPTTKLYPRNSFLLQLLGYSFELQKNYKTAAQYYERAISFDSEKLSLVLDLSRILYRQGRIAQSRKLIESISIQQPKKIVFIRLKEAHLESNQKIRAEKIEEVYKQFSPLMTKATDLRISTALFWVEAQQAERAIRDLTILLAFEPDKGEARFYLGQLYSSIGRRTEAVAEFDKISPEDPMYLKGKTLAVMMLQADNNYDQAIVHLQDVIDRESDNRQLRDLMIALLRGGKHFSRAKEFILKRLVTEADDLDLLFSYAIVLYDLKEFEKSLQVMEKIISHDPENAEALNFVAYGLAEKESDLSRALGYIERALKIEPENAYYIDTLGWVYFKMGRYQDAKRELSRAVASKNEDLVLMDHLADTCLKLQEYEEAIKWLVAVASAQKPTAEEEEQLTAWFSAKDKLKQLLRSYPNLTTLVPADLRLEK